MQRAALHAAAVAVSVENITVKSTPKKAVFVTAYLFLAFLPTASDIHMK
jgi:hypothetical protein